MLFLDLDASLPCWRLEEIRFQYQNLASEHRDSSTADGLQIYSRAGCTNPWLVFISCVLESS
jgi:hypothetical protein